MPLLLQGERGGGSAPEFSPTSEAQLNAWDEGRLAAPEEVGAGVWAIASPIPEGSLPATLTYLLVSPDGSLHLIDPGWGGAAALEALAHSVGSVGFSLDRVRTVIATHFHPDHLGLCAEVRERFSARLVMSTTERTVLLQESASTPARTRELDDQLGRWGVPADARRDILSSFDRARHTVDAVPDVLLDDGASLDLEGHTLEVIATPGHTQGHVCFADRDRKLLYTGDHVLPRIFSGIGLGFLPDTDPIEDFLHSLERLSPYAEYEVLPGHEFRFRGLEGRRHEIVNHHLRRTRAVAALTESLGETSSVWEYARRLPWTGGWSALAGFRLHSALRQTELHRGFVASGSAAAWLSRYVEPVEESRQGTRP